MTRPSSCSLQAAVFFAMLSLIVAQNIVFLEDCIWSAWVSHSLLWISRNLLIFLGKLDTLRPLFSFLRTTFLIMKILTAENNDGLNSFFTFLCLLLWVTKSRSSSLSFLSHFLQQVTSRKRPQNETSPWATITTILGCQWQKQELLVDRYIDVAQLPRLVTL